MSIPYNRPTEQATPPFSFANPPFTPPPTDKKSLRQARQVIALFRERQARRHTKQDPWAEFQLAPGEYAEIERLLSHDEVLSGFVKDKIRYDYNLESHRLTIRMPTGIHELFIDGVEDAIRTQLKCIRSGEGNAALFARDVRPARSTEIYFPVENGPSSAMSKYEPDASFWHDNARYPGVIIEVAYSQKRKRLGRLAEDYLLDSNASVRVVVGLDIEYGRRGKSEATLSVWRTGLFPNADGDGLELRVVREVEDQAFRDEQGNPTNHPGLQLHLSDFACEELTRDVINSEEDQKIIISTQDLCQYLVTAENKTRMPNTLVMHPIVPGVKKRKRLETPPEEITSSDEAKYVKEEEREAKRIADGDPDFKITSC